MKVRCLRLIALFSLVGGLLPSLVKAENGPSLGADLSLHLPYVSVAGTFLWADFAYKPLGSGGIGFELRNYGPSSRPSDSENLTTVSSALDLFISRILLGGWPYWASLTFDPIGSSSGTIIFRVTDFGLGFIMGTEVGTPVNAGAKTEIVDPVSGHTVILPNGGQGTLKTAPITSAPLRPYDGGEGVRIEFTGGEDLQLRVAHGPEELVWIYAFGPSSGAVDNPEGVTSRRWIGLPLVSEGMDSDTFGLNPPPNDPRSVSERGALQSAGNPSPYSHYWIYRKRPTDTEVQKRVLIGLQMREDVDAWLNTMSPTLRARAEADVNGSKTAHCRYWDGNYYLGFVSQYLYSYAARPSFGFVLDATAGNIAHEVGHYMTHIILGDEKYYGLQNTAKDNHGVGDVWPGRLYFLEEYAFWSEYMLLGTVGSIHPFAPANPSVGLFQNPTAVDVPSTEGFGVALLARLTATTGEMTSVPSGKNEAIPVVGLSNTQILDIIADGATSINGLRGSVWRFLGSNGFERAALSVIAERLGWSYHGKGRLVDGNNQPIAGAEIRAVQRVGTTDYGMQDSDVVFTDGDGKFIIGRLFPGDTIFEVTMADDTKAEVNVSTGWNGATNDELDLGDVNIIGEYFCHATLKVGSFKEAVAGGYYRCVAGCYPYYGGVSDIFRGTIANDLYYSDTMWCHPDPVWNCRWKDFPDYSNEMEFVVDPGGASISGFNVSIAPGNGHTESLTFSGAVPLHSQTASSFSYRYTGSDVCSLSAYVGRGFFGITCDGTSYFEVSCGAKGPIGSVWCGDAIQSPWCPD